MTETKIGNTGWKLRKEYFENENEKRAYNDGVYDFEIFAYAHKKWGKIEFQRYYGGDFPFDNLTGNFANNNDPWYEIIMPDGEEFTTQDTMFIFECDFLEEVTNELGIIEYRCVAEEKEAATGISTETSNSSFTGIYKNRGRQPEAEEVEENWELQNKQ